MTSRPDFNPSCPSGGTWYACGNGTRFTGCCGKYPCTDTGCPAGLLYPASFEGDKYGTFPDQECSAGLFYTCNFTTPRFLGCCQSGACANSNGCPSSDLAAAFLSKNPSIANAFDPQPPLPGAASATPSSTSTSASGTAAAASSSAATASEKPSTPVGAIAGGVAGGVALLCAIVFIIWRVRYNSKISSKQHRQRRNRPIPPFHDQYNAYTSNDYKGVMAGSAPLHAPYSDSPSMAPPYSGYHSPAPGFSSHKYSPQPPGLHEYVLEADGRPAFKQYSPEPAAQHTPHNQSHLSPPTSHGHAYSTSWDSSTAVDTAHTTAPSQSQVGPSRFARVYQGPPQELGDNSEGRRIGLGVHHVITNHRPRAELDGGTIQE